MSKVEKKDKPKRINSYNIALREWNAERKKRNLKWLSPKKGTPEYQEVQALKKQIEEQSKKPKEKKVVKFNDEKVKNDKKNVKPRDSHDSAIKKLMKTNAILTDKIVAETDTKKVLELVERLKMNTQMLVNVREMKSRQ
jgi:hypothetical protein